MMDLPLVDDVSVLVWRVLSRGVGVGGGYRVIMRHVILLRQKDFIVSLNND
jgi:hypothetical protein